MYAGFRKSGSLQVPNTHPAYVMAEELERVWALQQQNRGRVQKGISATHPRRRTSDNPFLLTGIS